MKCPKCGKECNELNSVSSNTYICLFCGNNFSSDGNSREDINQIMKNLIEQYGVVLLEDINKTNALLMDYAPHSDKERKLIVMAMREGIASQLIKITSENEDNQKLRINRCVKQLIESIWITEAAAKYAVLVLASAIGINVQFDIDSRVSSAQSEETNKVNKYNHQVKVLTKDMGISSEDAINYALKECGAIGYKALAANINAKHLILSDTVRVIYPKAFMNCINLSSIVIPKEIQSIGTGVFEGCCLLEKIEISDGSNYKVLDGVLIDKINKRAMRAENDNGRHTVNIVNGVTTICRKAFERSTVKQIDIPMSVNKIENDAFYLTMNLERIEVDSKNGTYRSIDGVVHDKRGRLLIKYPQGKKEDNYYLEDSVEEIGLQAFSCAKNIQTVTFTSALKRIGSKAFEYCSNIENLLLPMSIETIGERAFQYCENMRSIMLSRSITEIGDCAFFSCISLETISIPREVQKIGNLAFANCKKLRSVTVQDNISFIGDGAFAGCTEIEILIKNNSYIETYCRSRGIRFSNI